MRSSGKKVISYSRELGHNVKWRASTQRWYCKTKMVVELVVFVCPATPYLQLSAANIIVFLVKKPGQFSLTMKLGEAWKKKENWTKHRKYMQKEKKKKSLKSMNVKCRNCGRQTMIISGLCTKASPTKFLPEVKYIKKSKEEIFSIVYSVTMK